ncbi:hypothetical protein BH23CHL8_BH23CHL8_27210 [soil metagenome]
MTVVGARYDAAAQRFRAISATQDGGWLVSRLDSVAAESVHLAVDGDPMAEGWMAGRAIQTGILVRTCAVTAGSAGVRDERRSLRRSARRAVQRAERRPNPEGVARPDRRVRLASRASDIPALRIQAAVADDLVLRDVGTEVGLPAMSLTWRSVVADFDRDGRPDIFLGRHGEPAILFLRRDGGFEDAGVAFGSVDRHGCAAADIDRSGLPDLYCAIGAFRGSGIKANELWLDPGGPAPSRHPTAGGAIEPFGRGRLTAFLDVDQDGDQDLFVSNEPLRVDGFPSLNRVYELVGRADLRSRPARGLDPFLGAERIEKGDVDRDGRTDLLTVHYEPRVAEPWAGVHLYRNLGGRFREITRQVGIRPINDIDAELVDLNGDGRLDLVQLAWLRVRVSLQRKNGTFRTVWERGLENGVAVAVAAGDIDGDGDQDLYVLRQKPREDVHDLILLNDGNGRGFQVLAAPSRHGGQADDVMSIDHDGDGRTEFLVLNGIGAQPGPLQLIGVNG